jgi:hypothetical protein
MLHNESRMTPLESRKHLLIAESDLNRIQMQENWHELTTSLSEMGHCVQSAMSFASVAALVVASVSAFRGGKATNNGDRTSWFQRILKGAQMAGTLWMAYRSHPR